jgi:alpha-N-arabinofuranosidase
VRVETGDDTPLGLSVSASRKGQDLVVTLVNPKHDKSVKVNCELAGVKAESARAQVLHHADFNACNTFDRPNEIVPKNQVVGVQGSKIMTELPPLSIVTAIVRVA